MIICTPILNCRRNAFSERKKCFATSDVLYDQASLCKILVTGSFSVHSFPYKDQGKTVFQNNNVIHTILTTINNKTLNISIYFMKTHNFIN